MPAVQQTDFVTWITHMSGMWLRNPPPDDAVYTAALVNFGEMLITGCTASADQHYLYGPGLPEHAVDRTVDAAREIGIRFHPARGCTMGVSKGGLVRDEITQPENTVLKHAEALIAKYHDPKPNAMIRMILAPLGPYSDAETIYREMRVLADEHPGVMLHTHLHEVSDYDLCKTRYGVTPLGLMERAGWIGDRVLFYHMSAPAPSGDEIRQIARMGVHVSHCCGSDMALSYGLPPVRELLDAGAHVCLGTTGCASNLGGHILIEAHSCMRFIACDRKRQSSGFHRVRCCEWRRETAPMDWAKGSRPYRTWQGWRSSDLRPKPSRPSGTARSTRGIGHDRRLASYKSDGRQWKSCCSRRSSYIGR